MSSSSTKKLPELLMPAGSKDKAFSAFRYGADAVYIGVPMFSLRTRENCITENDITEIIEYAHKNGKKVYVTVNGFPHEFAIEQIKKHLAFLETVLPDGVIFADLGVLALANEFAPSVPKHLSVQQSTVNIPAMKLWMKMGVERVILAREMAIREVKKVHEALPDLELEYFVHGAVCMAYSGRCLLSNFTGGRDANRGACNHTCRWNYRVFDDEGREIDVRDHEDTREEEKEQPVQEVTDIYFVRHGESKKNTPVQIESCTIESAEKYPLTQKGIHNAEQEAQKYKNAFDVIISSPFLRARQTADIFRKYSPRAQYLENKDLSDLDVGEFDDKPLSQSDEYRKTILSTEKFGGGESLEDLKKRILSVYTQIQEEHKGKRILIVSHGCPLETLFDALQGNTLHYWENWMEHTKVFRALEVSSKKEGSSKSLRDFEDLKFWEEEERQKEIIPVEEDFHGTHIMSSKDMCMIEELQKVIDGGVCSLKVEGRNKTAYYAATIARAYRSALDTIAEGKEFDESLWEEVHATANRGFFPGFLNGKPRKGSIKYEANASKAKKEFCARVVGWSNGRLEIIVKNKIEEGADLEIVMPKREDDFSIRAEEMMFGNTHTQTLHGGNINKKASIKCEQEIPEGIFIRQKASNPGIKLSASEEASLSYKA